MKKDSGPAPTGPSDLDRLERLLTRWERLEAKPRPEPDREQWLARQRVLQQRIDQTLTEIGQKLNALCGYVDHWRNPPQS